MMIILQKRLQWNPLRFGDLEDTSFPWNYSGPTSSVLIDSAGSSATVPTMVCTHIPDREVIGSSSYCTVTSSRSTPISWIRFISWYGSHTIPPALPSRRYPLDSRLPSRVCLRLGRPAVCLLFPLILYFIPPDHWKILKRIVDIRISRIRETQTAYFLVFSLLIRNDIPQLPYLARMAPEMIGPLADEDALLPIDNSEDRRFLLRHLAGTVGYDIWQWVLGYRMR